MNERGAVDNIDVITHDILRDALDTELEHKEKP